MLLRFALFSRSGDIDEVSLLRKNVQCSEVRAFIRLFRTKELMMAPVGPQTTAQFEINKATEDTPNQTNLPLKLPRYLHMTRSRAQLFKERTLKDPPVLLTFVLHVRSAKHSKGAFWISMDPTNTSLWFIHFLRDGYDRPLYAVFFPRSWPQL